MFLDSLIFKHNARRFPADVTDPRPLVPAVRRVAGHLARTVSRRTLPPVVNLFDHVPLVTLRRVTVSTAWADLRATDPRVVGVVAPLDKGSHSSSSLSIESTDSRPSSCQSLGLI